MLFRDISLLDENFETQKNVCVGIKNGKIHHIGAYQEGYGEEFDGNGYLLAPAFCSAHSHTAMTLLRGIGGDLPLSRWLNEAIFPEEARFTPRDIYHGTLAGTAEMIKYGTVGCNDMYFSGIAIAEAFHEAGMKANLSLAVTSADENKAFWELPVYGEGEKVKDFIKDKKKLTLDYSFHAEYTNTVKSMASVAEKALSDGVGLHIHMSETQTEHEECVRRHGKTPAGLFAGLGVFESRTVAAHCVWCDGDDFDIMREKGVFMASCPTSNLKLGSGIPDYKSALEKEVSICIGTDGAASNDNLNMLKEAKLMALLAKGKNLDPSLCPAKTALRAATRLAWLSMGRQNSGLVRVGFDADLAVYDLTAVNTRKSRDGAGTLLYACDGEAYMTLCDGRVLYKNGEYFTIDTEKLVYEARGA